MVWGTTTYWLPVTAQNGFIVLLVQRSGHRNLNLRKLQKVLTIFLHQKRGALAFALLEALRSGQFRVPVSLANYTAGISACAARAQKITISIGTRVNGGGVLFRLVGWLVGWLVGQRNVQRVRYIDIHRMVNLQPPIEKANF